MNKFNAKITQSRFYLRKVAAIVACLAVTTMFASCDGKKNGDDDDSGKIDTKLVGQWDCSFQYVDMSSGLLLTSNYRYYFYKDGNFINFSIDWWQEKYVGKYSVSDGKIYFTDRTRYDGGTPAQITENVTKFGSDYLKYVFYSTVKLDDMTAEYKFGSDEEGNYLQVAVQSGIDLYRPVSAGDKFRKK
jgi:hypothetical protein